MNSILIRCVGPVKDFTQTLMDEQGEVTKRVSGLCRKKAVLIHSELLDLENNTGGRSGTGRQLLP
ncbi:YnfC family lipoprotein [Escherichia coli]|uniref:YnfC family lipoprotein n=1 Tax=Escherichia coli TaxID=562 RepID=UPI0024C4D8A0|nr:YnfC family lipoprotein [Escherichia coli]